MTQKEVTNNSHKSLKKNRDTINECTLAPIGVRPLELIKGKSVCESNNIFNIPLEFFIFLIVIIGIVIVSSIVVIAIKKLQATKSG